MQLHACLLLFIITTDNTLAWLHNHCGGNISLNQDPAGGINLTLPRVYPDSGKIKPVKQQLDKLVSVCVWVIDIPEDRTVFLKLLRLDSGSNVSVRCAWNKESQILESGGKVRLYGCDRNKATLSWTGVGHSADAVQLAYYVQEDERNSSEEQISPHSDSDFVHWAQTGTSFTSTAPFSQEGVRSPLYEDGEWSHGPVSASTPSYQDQGLSRPSSTLQGRSVAGTADKATLALPEEEPNNGTDASGAVHLTDGPIPARVETHTNFRPMVSTSSVLHTSHSENTETSDPLSLTQTAVKDAAATSSNTNRVTSKSELSTAAKAEHTMSSSRVPRQDDWSNAHTASEDTVFPSSSQGPGQAHLPSTHGTGLHPAESTVEAASPYPHTSLSDSSVSPVSDDTHQTSKTAEMIHTPPFFAPSQTRSPGSPQGADSTVHSLPPYVPSPSPHARDKETETAAQSTKRDIFDANTVTSPMPSWHDATAVHNWPSEASSAPRAAQTMGDIIQSPAATETTSEAEVSTLLPPHRHTNEPTPLPHSSPHASRIPSHALQTSTTFSPYFTHSLLPLNSRNTLSTVPTPTTDHAASPTQMTKSTPLHTPHTQKLLPPTNAPAEHPQSNNISPTDTSLLSLSTAKSDDRHGDGGVDTRTKLWKWFPSSTTISSPTTGQPQQPPTQTTPYSSGEKHTALMPSVFTSTHTWSSTSSQPPRIYIVPDQPVTIRVKSVEVLLQIIVEESTSALSPGLEEDMAAWVEPFLQKAPGFNKLLGVWSNGHAVQSLLEFKSSKALKWLSMTGPASLLERTGLSRAAREGRSFRSSKITNVTLGGVQEDVCEWLLQCPSGYKCVSQPGISNYSCSSACHFGYCHHHGVCTHHLAQLPVCHCLAGEDFWYMGQRCDVRMTRARLIGACLAILLIIVTVIGVLAFVAVRRYRAILIQAKVDQTRSSYCRFNHFDELSGRFWLRSWAGSADSLDNPAFTRSDELLHLRALDRPCCYHDDTLSLASTCPSHGACINTIYPNSSQYGWRGSEMSMGDGVLDSGKASDLSVCSWPVEPIQWTPFPLLQQLAAHRSPTVRVRASRPRSYCEGMELVDMGKSWTA